MLERILNGTGYLCIGAGTAWLLLHPPSSMGTALGAALTVIWCAFMFASVPAAVAAYRGKFAAEYAALPFLVGALVIALVHAYLHLSPESGTRVFYITALAFCYSVRFFVLHRLMRKQSRRTAGGRRRWTGTRSRH